jgi:hypothetical protein
MNFLELFKYKEPFIIGGVVIIASISLFLVPEKAEIIIPTAISALAGMAGLTAGGRRSTDITVPNGKPPESKI